MALMPFAVGYFLSYVFRTINAVIAGSISSELGLTPADLGLLTSVYFLAMAVVQLPLGALLDRYGPRRVQMVLLLIAAAGALLFANSISLSGLLLGRFLIGIGFATSLLAGLKAIVLGLPCDHIASANGCLISFGALGAIAATGVAQPLVDANGWRSVVQVLGVLTALCAAALYALAPEAQVPRSRRGQSDPVTFRFIYADRRFWRLAPLSATCIGTAWAIQGLWAGPWLMNVEGYDRDLVVRCLLVMAVALCLAAAALGQLASTLRRNGVSTEALLSATAAVSILAQMALVLRWPIPPVVAFAIIGASASATVLSYAIMPGYFPAHASARANAALDLLHLCFAFAVQWSVGIIIGSWPSAGTHQLAHAYQAAFAVTIAAQGLALLWFIGTDSVCKVRKLPTFFGAYRPAKAFSRYAAARKAWTAQLATVEAHVRYWRLAALGSFATSVLLIFAFVGSFGNATSTLPALKMTDAPSPRFIVGLSSKPNQTDK